MKVGNRARGCGWGWAGFPVGPSRPLVLAGAQGAKCPPESRGRVLSLSGAVLSRTRKGALYLSFVCQVIPVSSFTRSVRHDRGCAVNELVFRASAPPLGFRTYSASRLPGEKPAPARELQHLHPRPGTEHLSWAIENQVWGLIPPYLFCPCLVFSAILKGPPWEGLMGTEQSLEGHRFPTPHVKVGGPM